MIIEEIEKDIEDQKKVAEDIEPAESSSVSLAFHTVEKDFSEVPKTSEKSLQVHMVQKFRSKAAQTEIKLISRMTSPLKPTCKSLSISPFKIENLIANKLGACGTARKIFSIGNHSDSDISYTPSVSQIDSSSLSSSKSLHVNSISDCSDLIEEDKKQEMLKILETTIIRIERHPRFYVGVPKSC